MSKFKVGDRVVANSGMYSNLEFVVTEVVSQPGSPHGKFYYKGDPNGYGVWEKFLKPVKPEATNRFQVGDLAKIVGLGYGSSPGFRNGDIVEVSFLKDENVVYAGPKGHDPKKVHHVDPTGSASFNVDDLEKVATDHEFQVGDVVEVKPDARWVSNRGEEVISELKVGKKIGGDEEERYALTDKHPSGVWLDNIRIVRSAAEKAAEDREKAFQSLAVGDLVEVSRGDRKIVDRVQGINQVWRASAGDLSLGNFTILPNTSVKFYRETGWDIRVIEKAPKPVKPERVLPTKPGLYVSQHLVIFALTEGGQWREARGKGQSYLPGVVKYDTLREDKHFPLLPLHSSSTPK